MRGQSETTMQLPNHCTLLSEDVMRAVFGGWQQELRRDYLDKNYCLETGEFFLTMGYLKGMTSLQIAQELYAHAMVYYASNILVEAGIDLSIIREIQAHANPVDLEDGGDTWYRQAAYALIWQTC